MLAARIALSALAVITLSDTAYNLNWRPAAGQVIDYRVQANGTMGQQAVKAITTLRAKVQTVEKGRASGLNLGTSAGAISTPEGRTELPNLSSAYDLSSPENSDAPGLGIFGNVPMFLFRTVDGAAIRVGQTWKRGTERRLKAEAIEPLGAGKAMRVSLASDPKAKDQVDGTYWISIEDGAVLKAKVHTKTQIGDEDDTVGAEWTITIDRLPSAKSAGK